MSGSSVCQPEGSEFEFYLRSQTNPTTNSLRFWLTERWHGLAGNGPYCGKRLSQALPRLHVGLPKSPRPGLSECASQSLRRGVRFWLTALVSAPGHALGRPAEVLAMRRGTNRPTPGTHEPAVPPARSNLRSSCQPCSGK